MLFKMIYNIFLLYNELLYMQLYVIFDWKCSFIWLIDKMIN